MKFRQRCDLIFLQVIPGHCTNVRAIPLVAVAGAPISRRTVNVCANYICTPHAERAQFAAFPSTQSPFILLSDRKKEELPAADIVSGCKYGASSADNRIAPATSTAL